MNRLLKSAVLGLAVTATTLSALPAAQAGDGWRRHNYDHYHGTSNGDLVAAGVLGLAVGALAAGVATAPSRNTTSRNRSTANRSGFIASVRCPSAAIMWKSRRWFMQPARSSRGRRNGTTIAKIVTARSTRAPAPSPAMTASGISARPTDHWSVGPVCRRDGRRRRAAPFASAARLSPMGAAYALTAACRLQSTPFYPAAFASAKLG